MTVRLLAPWNGYSIGQLYDEADQNYLVGVGKADGELSRGTMFTTPQTSHTLTASDATRERQFTAAGAVTVRVPATLRDMPFGILATYRQSGAGQITITGDNGVTVSAPTGTVAKSAGVGAVIQLEKTDATTVYVLGSLATS